MSHRKTSREPFAATLCARALWPLNDNGWPDAPAPANN
jgi:hypothetical protein